MSCIGEDLPSWRANFGLAEFSPEISTSRRRCCCGSNPEWCGPYLVGGEHKGRSEVELVGIEGGEGGGGGRRFEGLCLVFVGVFGEEGVGDADVVAVGVLLFEGEHVRIMLDSLAE